MEAHEPKLFREVLCCFARYPQRQDTLEGITQWWLLENRIEWAVWEVQAALDELVKRGLVTSKRAADGQTHYRFNVVAKSDAEKLLGPRIVHGPP